MNLKRFLTISFSNLGLKVFALFVSALVWFHATTERTYSTEKKVRTVYTGLKDSLFILNELPGNLRARVVGKGKSLINMSLFARPEAIIDLSELKPGKNTVAIDRSVLTIPHGLGVDVQAVHPSEIEFLVDVLSKRKVKVHLRTEGEPKKGFIFRGGKLNETVYLYGPSQVIRNHATVEMKPVSLAKRDTTFEFEAPLIPPGEKTWVEPSVVTGQIVIVPASYREFEGVKVEAKAPEGYQAMFAPGEVSVRVFGLEERIRKMREDEVAVVLDLSNLGEGTYDLEPRVVAPDGVKVDAVVPPKVRVIISP